MNHADQFKTKAPLSRKRRIAVAMVACGIAAMSLKRTDFGNDLRRDVIRNTVGFAPVQFYQALNLTDEAAASGGILTIAHNAGDRKATAELALAFGADVIEVDVVAIGDQLYAAHDQPNERIAGVTFRGPSLESIWSVADGNSRIELDLKQSSPQFLRLLVDFINDHGGGQDVIIATRSQSALVTLGNELPDATLLYSVGDTVALVSLHTNDTLLEQIDGVSVRSSLLDAESVDWFKEHDLLVFAWTVNDIATVDNLLELGVDGVATDNLAIIEHYDEGN